MTGERRYRRMAAISTAGVAVAVFVIVVEVLVGYAPGPVGACSLALAGLLTGPFVAAWLDAREDELELELAVLRRRVLFCPDRPLTRREHQRLGRSLSHPPRNRRSHVA